MRESAIEGYLCRQIIKMGGLAIKFTSQGRRGMPDRICILPNLCFWVEVKAPNGKLTSLQQREISRLRSYNMEVSVVYDKEDVDMLIARLKIKLENI